jgi:ribosomal silencing factor RsfS
MHRLPQGRGDRGVFEVGELVAILRQEKVARALCGPCTALQLRDVVVVRVPEERQYCDHLVIATGRNNRHIAVVSTIILSVFKSRMLSSDKVPEREGGQHPACGWIAMDMGNVALHLFDQVKFDFKL